jgi:hypothetical protein
VRGASGGAHPSGHHPSAHHPGAQGGALAGSPLGAQLGDYGPLIDAVRQELEHFIVSQLRLHLAIADRDRFVLTGIGVQCQGDDAARERLLRFMREFKPEQVKRYLVREVIAGLPNAAAIDLGQFGGLIDGESLADPQADDYRDLLAELAGPTEAGGPPYEVTLLGRWSEIDATPPASVRSVAAATGTLVTPLAGPRCEFDLEDADGRRRVVLPAVVAGRRYVVGKGEGCDIVVRGTYTSRRHAELWLDQGHWWAADAGSTNGIRIETPGTAAPQVAAPAAAGDATVPLRLAEGARLIMSARSDGPPGDHPWLALRGPAFAGGAAAGGASRVTPIAAAPRTPLTAVMSGHAPASFTLLDTSGRALLALSAAALPMSIGRSRQSTLVIDRRHDAVSGHHLDVVALDAAAADIVVVGDNGVLLGSTHHRPGARVRWPAGQPLVLGPRADDAQACTLLLRRDSAEGQP